MRAPGWALMVLASAGAVYVMAGSSPRHTAGSTDTRHGHDHGIVALPWDAHTRVVDDGLALRVAPMELTAATVTYVGFDAFPQARTAFQHAVDIWMASIDSSVPVTVRAEFTTLGPSTLGSAGPGNFFRGLQPQPDTWYPVALANKLAGQDLDPSGFDVLARFNNQFPWYFGTDGHTPPGQYDFVTVVLHELGHGLGFVGSMTVDPSSGAGSWGLGTPYPFSYDRFTVNGAQQALLSFASPSFDLAEQLRSGNVSWNGAAGRAANGGVRPRLYAPIVWAQGSSYSHLDESSFPAGTINSLMTYALAAAESIHIPGPVTQGMFQDMGWGAPPPPLCTFALSSGGASIGVAGGVGNFTVMTEDRCSWTTASNSSFVSITSPTGPRSGTGVVTFAVAPNTGVSLRVGTITAGAQTFAITQTGSGPVMSVTPSTLRFGAVNSGSAFAAVTGAQTVRLTQGSAGFVTWSASSSAPWLRVTPQTGSAPANVMIEVVHHPSVPMSGSLTGTVNFTFSGAGAGAGPVTVTLASTPIGASEPPFGSFDTPADLVDRVTGSIALTGWALDDTDVTAVRILRSTVVGICESPLPIGTATMVDGARPDIVDAFPTYPRNTRGGWGYILLTNFLPNLGNGTFTLCAVADDAEGRSTLLGVKTITVTNSSAVKPFGAIDTPAPGATISGTSFNNFGWVLSPGPSRADPPSGGSVTVFINGEPVGTPSGWTSRPDLTALFPSAQYPGIGNAAGVFTFNPQTYGEGVHTIAWSVTNNLGETDGIGSRYFTVVAASAVEAGAANAGVVVAPGLAREIAAAPPSRTVIRVRRGYDLATPLRAARGDAEGRTILDGEELDRFELHLRPGLAGYLRVGGDLSPLPIGSRLDPVTGTFTWQPGVGFVGRYDFVFVEWAGGRAMSRQEISITLHPRGSNRVGPQVVIDTPAPGGVVVSGLSRTMTIAGWALDLDDGVDTGVTTLHVWAYPVDALTGVRLDPHFLGVAAYGGERPDVAATFGERYLRSGYGLTVDHLEPGTYDLAVFALSSVRRGFVPAKVVRVTVR